MLVSHTHTYHKINIDKESTATTTTYKLKQNIFSYRELYEPQRQPYKVTRWTKCKQILFFRSLYFVTNIISNPQNVNKTTQFRRIQKLLKFCQSRVYSEMSTTQILSQLDSDENCVISNECVQALCARHWTKSTTYKQTNYLTCKSDGALRANDSNIYY